jgi:hypothetical protein
MLITLTTPSPIVIIDTVFNGKSFQPSIIAYMCKINRFGAHPSVSLIKKQRIALKLIVLGQTGITMRIGVVFAPDTHLKT